MSKKVIVVELIHSMLGDEASDILHNDMKKKNRGCS